MSEEDVVAAGLTAWSGLLGGNSTRGGGVSVPSPKAFPQAEESPEESPLVLARRIRTLRTTIGEERKKRKDAEGVLSDTAEELANLKMRIGIGAAHAEKKVRSAEAKLEAAAEREEILLGRIKQLESIPRVAECEACREVEPELERLREALGFYEREDVWAGTGRGPLMTDRSDWRPGDSGLSLGGKVARKALGKQVGRDREPHSAEEESNPTLGRDERLARVMAMLEGRKSAPSMSAALPPSSPAGLPKGLKLREKGPQPKRNGRPPKPENQNWPWA